MAAAEQEKVQSDAGNVQHTEEHHRSGDRHHSSSRGSSHHHSRRSSFRAGKGGGFASNVLLPAFGILAAAALVFGGVLMIKKAKTESQDGSLTDTSAQYTVPPEVVTGTRETADKIAEANITYVCPVDFEKLQKENPDIYAWITVPGTNIDYPLLRSEEDDSYYLNHDQNGKYSIAGAIFTETRYNSADLSDPVTMVYGHRMDTDTMFGMLQRFYSDPGNLAEYDTIMIYTSEKAYRYRIFAGVPHSDEHLLYNRDLSTAVAREELINNLIGTTMLGSAVDPDYEFDPVSRFLILSTCYRGNIQKRFLVCSYLDMIIE